MILLQKALYDGTSAFVGEAMCDIKKGDEFYMDYRRFKNPDFYEEFLERNRFKDFCRVTFESVYGSDREADIYAEGKPITEDIYYQARINRSANSHYIDTFLL